jgi:hypothetical protein
VFMHKFSEAHREIFYVANPKLKPIEWESDRNWIN